MPDPKKIRLTPAEAKRKWGELLHAPTQTYRHFEDGGGDWRPELHAGELTGYIWQKRHKASKRWRRKN